MTSLDVGGADRMRQADKVIDAIAKKLEAHRAEVGKAVLINVTCRIDGTKVEVKLQTTFG